MTTRSVDSSCIYLMLFVIMRISARDWAGDRDRVTCSLLSATDGDGKSILVELGMGNGRNLKTL